MQRLVQVVTTVAAPVGALYGFAPAQTGAVIALMAQPFMRQATRAKRAN